MAKRLPKLVKLGVRLPATSERLTPLTQAPTQAQQGLISEREKWMPQPGEPFSSAEDKWGYYWLYDRDPQWLPQVPFRQMGVNGNSSADAYHPLRKIALFFDGKYFHTPHAAYDLVMREALRMRGITYKAFHFTDWEDFVTHFPQFIETEVGL